MFGTNTRQGKVYFKDYATDTLAVNTVFATLQGEGPFSGKRCMFLRLSKCNLACTFCDTSFEEVTVYQFEDLRDYLTSKVVKWYEDNSIWYDTNYPLDGWGLVVTGGEPLLQDNLFEFLNRCLGGYHPKSRFNWIQIESNGIPPWKDDMHELDDVTLVVSPKCLEKNDVAVHHIKPNNITLDRANCLKFVISADQNSAYSTIPHWALEWRKETGRTIWLSPMNVYLREPQANLLAAKTNKILTIEQRETLEKISFWEEGLLDMKANRANHEYAAELCMRHDCRLSLQTHLLASLP